MADRKRASGLGRGLAALLEEAGPAGDMTERLTVALADIVANPAQPRRRFDPDTMAELADSVRLHGILQPILVRPVADGRYEIIAGERRWRAAQAVPLHEVPVIIRRLDDAAAYEIALIENVQRADLNPIEEAEGFARLVRDYGHTQEALGKIVGKARSHVANLLRLLELPDAVRALLETGELSMGHARALIGSVDATELAERVVAQRLSVRQTEALVRARSTTASKPRGPKLSRDPNVAELEMQLADALGMTVQIATSDAAGKGRVAIEFSTLDQLDLLCALLNGNPR